MKISYYFLVNLFHLVRGYDLKATIDKPDNWSAKHSKSGSF